MGLFEKMMNEYYTEKLAEYGYVKVKGRYPYWAKMVGDEIVLIITYASEMANGTKPLEAFSLWGTVATVYRPKIDFEHSPKSQRDYMVCSLRMYQSRVRGSYLPEEGKKRFIFQCNGADEKSVKRVCESSYKVCEEEIISRLNIIKSLADVKKFYDEYIGSRILSIYPLRDMQVYYENNSSEALLWPILYSKEEYVAIQMENLSRYMEKITEDYVIKRGRLASREDYHLEAKKKRDINIDIFINVKNKLDVIMKNNRENNYFVLKKKGVIK